MTRWAATAFVALAATIIAFVACFRLDVLVDDFLVVRGGPPPRDDIVIVTITEETLATLPYRSPIDRGFLAGVVQAIDAAGPRAIGLDILIDQPSEPSKDQQLKSVLENLASPLVLAMATGEEQLSESQQAFLKQFSNGLERALVTLKRDELDGIVRRVFSGRTEDGSIQPAFALALAKKTDPQASLADGRITYQISAPSAAAQYPAYPAHTAAFLPTDWLKDKIVLIGTDLPAIDRHATPFSNVLGAQTGSFAGVAVHAHIAGQILNRTALRSLPAAQALAILFFFASLTAIVVTRRILPVLRTIGVLLVMAIYAGLAAYSFATWETTLPMVSGLAAIGLTALVLGLREWFDDRRKRRFIQSAFSRYLSPAMVARIAKNPDALALGGEKRTVTYVFTDLEGFTTISEGLEPDRLADVLNRYLDQMCELFVAHEATIDKIIGDAVVGFFGAPEAQNDQCQRAVKLALAIDEFSEAFRKEQAESGLQFGVTRIGVHHGEAVIGNFGGNRFLDYTGIGDTVNTAARLEAANKHFGTRICISAPVAKAVPEQIKRPIGLVRLKGKTELLECFEPLSDDNVRAAREYANAYDLMSEGNSAALEAFGDIAKNSPEDGLVQLHIDRLARGEKGNEIILLEK